MSHRADPFSRDIADRHYNRQKIGSAQFAPPGRALVLKAKTDTGAALWITSNPYGKYVKHHWAGAWMCSAFRNEDAGIASELIIEAVAATRFFYGDPPLRGMVTFLDEKCVRPTKVRGRNVWGWTWLKAGFEFVGRTKGGLMVFQLATWKIPSSVPASGIIERHHQYRRPGTLLVEHLAFAGAI